MQTEKKLRFALGGLGADKKKNLLRRLTRLMQTELFSGLH